MDGIDGSSDGRQLAMKFDTQFDPLNPLTTQHSGSTVNRFLMGAVAGAAVALLFAPQAGRDSRAWLKDGTRKLRDGAGHRLDDVKGRLHDGAEVVKESVAAGKSAYRRAREESGTTTPTYGA
jgi:autotransporter adhesin